MVKKGLLGAALGAGTLFLVFGTSAPSYVRTAFHKVRHRAHDAVPVQFEIDRARDEVTNLEPAIIENRERLARAEVDVEHLEREIADTRTNLGVEKAALLALRDRVKSDFRLAGRHSEAAEEVNGELAHRLDHYRAASRILEDKEKTLKARHKEVVAARQQLTNMAQQKRTLLTKLEGIEAQLRMIEATQGKNDFNFDDSALSRAKQSVAELGKRLEVKARLAEMEGRYSGASYPEYEPSRDVIKEIDAEFNGPQGGSEGGTRD